MVESVYLSFVCNKKKKNETFCYQRSNTLALELIALTVSFMVMTTNKVPTIKRDLNNYNLQLIFNINNTYVVDIVSGYIQTCANGF